MKIILTVFILLSIFGLVIIQGYAQEKTEVNASKTSPNDQIYTLLDKANTQWMESYNKNAGDVSTHYISEAVLFPDTSVCIKGNGEIANYFKNNYKKISNINSIGADVRYKETSDLVYEIGHFSTDRKEEYQYLIIWKKNHDAWFRELEALSKKTANQHDYNEIDTAREKWIKMCNEHDPKKLVENLYIKDAFYYNRCRILQGWNDIALEYSYMASSSYTLNLEPKSIFMVQPDLAYEIGKCSGSYSGHYILRWVKDLSDEWKISLDSNY